MFPLDDSRLYSKQELVDAYCASATFAHASKARIEQVLDDAFSFCGLASRLSLCSEPTCRNDLVERIRATNSGVLPPLYRPAETTEYVASELGALCMLCLNTGACCGAEAYEFLAVAPPVHVINGFCEDHVFYEPAEPLCFSCAKSIDRWIEKNAPAGSGGVLAWNKEFPDPAVFMAAAWNMLRTPAFKKRALNGHQDLRFDPRCRKGAQ